MKLKEESKPKTNVNGVKKQKKNKNVSNIEVGNQSGGNVAKKKEKKKIINGEDTGANNLKSKKKFKEIIEATGAVKDVKSIKKSKKGESELVKPIVSVKKSQKQNKKQVEEKTSLKPSMSSSELLRKLETTILSDKIKSKTISDKTKSKTISDKTKSKTENQNSKLKTDSPKMKKTKKLLKSAPLKETSKKIENDENKVLEKVKKSKKFGKIDKMRKIKEERKQKIKAKLAKGGPSLKEAPIFHEENFNAILNTENIVKSVKALTKLVKKETEGMKNTIFKDYRYILNFGLFRVPSAPKHHVKLNIKHSLVGPDDEVLFIVKDLQRGLRIDYEPTIHHYQDLLRENDIEGIKTIMPFNQLKKEYNSYEMKRKLSNLYDYYICDGRIIGHVFGFLGTAFSTKQRCTVFAVRTENVKHLKKEIHSALHRTSFRQGSKGDNISVIIGNHNISSEQVAENILEVLEQLKLKLPGGYPNIRNINLKVNIKGTSSVPLYINMGKPPKNTPYVIGKKEQKLNKLKEKAEKILSNFTITNDGYIDKIPAEEIEAQKLQLEKLAKKEAKKAKKAKKAELEKLKQNLVEENKKPKDKKDKKNNKKELEMKLKPEDSEREDPDYEPMESGDNESYDSEEDDNDASD